MAMSAKQKGRRLRHSVRMRELEETVEDKITGRARKKGFYEFDPTARYREMGLKGNGARSALSKDMVGKDVKSYMDLAGAARKKGLPEREIEAFMKLIRNYGDIGAESARLYIDGKIIKQNLEKVADGLDRANLFDYRAKERIARMIREKGISPGTLDDVFYMIRNSNWQNTKKGREIDIIGSIREFTEGRMSPVEFAERRRAVESYDTRRMEEPARNPGQPTNATWAAKNAAERRLNKSRMQRGAEYPMEKLDKMGRAVSRIIREMETDPKTGRRKRGMARAGYSTVPARESMSKKEIQKLLADAGLGTKEVLSMMGDRMRYSDVYEIAADIRKQKESLKARKAIPGEVRGMGDKANSGKYTMALFPSEKGVRSELIPGSWKADHLVPGSIASIRFEMLPEGRILVSNIQSDAMARTRKGVKLPKRYEKYGDWGKQMLGSLEEFAREIEAREIVIGAESYQRRLWGGGFGPSALRMGAGKAEKMYFDLPKREGYSLKRIRDPHALNESRLSTSTGQMEPLVTGVWVKKITPKSDPSILKTMRGGRIREKD